MKRKALIALIAAVFVLAMFVSQDALAAGKIRNMAVETALAR